MTEALSELDVLAIVLLLPLAALMTTIQKNPYDALVMRGILGAIAALVYALLGAADVALTEALVGTMLAITLYAVAVRSSLVFRLGTIASIDPALPEAEAVRPDASGEPSSVTPSELETDDRFKRLRRDLREFCQRHYLRLEIICYPDREALAAALRARDVHAIGWQQDAADGDSYAIDVRIERLHTLIADEMDLTDIILTLTPIVESSAAQSATPSDAKPTKPDSPQPTPEPK